MNLQYSHLSNYACGRRASSFTETPRRPTPLLLPAAELHRTTHENGYDGRASFGYAAVETCGALVVPRIPPSLPIVPAVVEASVGTLAPGAPAEFVSPCDLLDQAVSVPHRGNRPALAVASGAPLSGDACSDLLSDADFWEALRNFDGIVRGQTARE